MPGLLPHLGLCEWCCYERKCVNVSSRPRLRCFWNPEELGLPGHMVVPFLIFREASVLLSVNSRTVRQRHQQRTRVPVSPHPAQHCSVLSVCFLDSSHPNWCEMTCMFLWFCISLVIGDVELLFICSLATRILSLQKCMFKFFAYFVKKGYLIFCCCYCSWLFFLDYFPTQAF